MHRYIKKEDSKNPPSHNETYKVQTMHARFFKEIMCCYHTVLVIVLTTIIEERSHLNTIKCHNVKSTQNKNDKRKSFEIISIPSNFPQQLKKPFSHILGDFLDTIVQLDCSPGCLDLVRPKVIVLMLK